MSDLYYTAPSDEIFDEVKQKSIELWKEVSDFPVYVNEKVDKIKDIHNIEDNMMCIVAMFDLNNQDKLAQKLSKEARIAIADRMRDGGVEDYYIVF